MFLKASRIAIGEIKCTQSRFLTLVKYFCLEILLYKTSYGFKITGNCNTASPFVDPIISNTEKYKFKAIIMICFIYYVLQYKSLK